ncbi:MAG: M28 family peptidase [Bacteroidetes bacterium]|nr:M28 family peptidase [Bacteroidota bacterium]
MRMPFMFLCLMACLQLGAQPLDRLIRDAPVKKTLTVLASDDMQGRRPGTAGIDKAAAYIARSFGKAGLQPLPGATDGYWQCFETLSATVLDMAVVINGKPLAAADFLAFPGKETLAWDDEGAETVYLDRLSNAVQMLQSWLQSDKDLLVVVDTSHRKALSRMRNMRMQRMGKGSVMVVLVAEPVCYYKVQGSARIARSRYANVVGMIPGRSRAGEKVLFSAHYDHLGIGKAVGQDSVYNGANDDASGTTAVIHLARYFGRMPAPERTLVFAAFTAEESGGYGSRYFSRQLNPDSVVAMFNIEMIGTESKWGANSAFITGYERSDFGSLLQESLQGSGFVFHPDPYPSQNLFYRSDNATLAALGVPAHTVSTSKMDGEKYYHTVDDEVETLDIANMTRIIRAIALSSQGIVGGLRTPRRIPKR